MSRPDLNRRAAEQCADAIYELLAEVDRLTAENEELRAKLQRESQRADMWHLEDRITSDALGAEIAAAEARAVRAEQAIQRVEKELAEWDRIGYPTDPDPQAAVRAALAGEDSTDEK